MPTAIMATTVATGMRNPRMQGAPAICLGLVVIRVKFMIVSLFTQITTVVCPWLCFCYNLPVEQKPLIETNPFLRDPEKFRKALITNVASSTAIETCATVASIVRMLAESKNLTAHDDARLHSITSANSRSIGL